MALSSRLLLLAALLWAACDDKPDAATLARGIKAKMALPARVDDDTRLDDVRAASATELGYHLTLVNMDRARAASKPVAEALAKNVRGTACTNPGYRQLFDAGFSVGVHYASSDGAPVLDLVLTPADCPR